MWPKNRIMILAGSVFVFIVAGVFAEAVAGGAEAQVKALIEKAYLNGAFNRLDTDAMRKGFHPGFKIHGVKNGELATYPIDEWIKNIEEMKKAEDFDPAKHKWTYRFVSIDVTGQAAAAKIELRKDNQLVFTDYLSLLKFKDGWKITDKVYHRHVEKK